MGFNDDFKSKFSYFLLRWNKKSNRRQMPWKGEKDPYKIWLSEIILQQTRVEQGLAYYQKFVERYPTIQKLAAGSDKEIYKLWEGLGYYNRCKNLITTARHISENLNGVFPKEYAEIISLRGIGEYTASAIASFAYTLPFAVVDGNVFRVLSRVFGIKKAIDSSEGKKYFKEFASALLNKKRSAEYNQAIMDFGAVVCKPVNPVCTSCVFKKHCYAFQFGLIKKLPFKEKKIKIKTRWFYYLVLEYRNKVYIKQRTGDDIWKNLFEFVLIEMDNRTDVKLILSLALKNKFISKRSFAVESISPEQSQQLSHQKIIGRFIRIKLKKAYSFSGLQAVPKSRIAIYPFPKYINSFLLSQDSRF